MARGILIELMNKAKYLTLAAAISVAAIVSAPAQTSALQSVNNTNPLEFLNLRPQSGLLWNKDQAQEPLIKRVETKSEPPSIPAPEKPKPEPRKYTVVENDNLSKIAAEQNTTWPRLWNKNTDLTNPDLIHIGQVLLIPDESEVLADRPVPQAVIAPSAVNVPAPRSTGVYPGNNYAPGNCTWYVKSRRADLPNDLGNANTWYYRAQAYGLPTGSTPRAGAVGTTGAGDLGHVVYVERVNGDGTILISEMNYAGLYSQRTRTAGANEFQYIY